MSRYLNLISALLGMLFFLITMYESFYPHDAMRITVCFGPFLEPMPHHNIFTSVTAILSILLLSFSGYRTFRKLPKIELPKSGSNILADSRDLDVHN